MLLEVLSKEARLKSCYRGQYGKLDALRKKQVWNKLWQGYPLYWMLSKQLAPLIMME
jgi:hypothetical protein